MSDTHREVELRLAIADPQALGAALRAAGATPIGEGRVQTASYDFPDRRLRAAGSTLRLREDWTGTTLTSKTPLPNGMSGATGETAGVRAREEVTLALLAGSGETAQRLLRGLGLVETLRYEKTRTSWQLGHARVDVDILADGGACYAEIEAEAEGIAATRARLGLDTAPVETRSYFEIVRVARLDAGS